MEEQTAEEKVFSNSVLVKEIFKALGPCFYKKEFRQVNHFIWRETLGIWRKKNKLNILEQVHVNLLGVNPSTLNGLFLLYSNWEEGLASLTTHPFHNVKMSEVTLSSSFSKRLNCEKFFWNVCAPHITHLELSNCTFTADCGAFSALKLIKRILTKTCPELEELLVKNCTQEEEDFDYDSEDENEEDSGETGKVAKKLTSIHLDQSNFVNMTFCRRILRLTPNLKDLSIGETDDGKVDALVFGLLLKKEIKLESYSVTNAEYYSTRFGALAGPLPFTPLLDYVKSFPVITELNLKTFFEDGDGAGININAAMYEAIGLCKNVEVLTISYQVHKYVEWYKDLKVVALKNLKIFRICFRYFLNADGERAQATKFDFGLLKNMPKLQELGIMHDTNRQNNWTRNTGSKDWLFDEPLPLPDQPLWTGSETLERLYFEGYHLTEEDIQLLHLWFPKLTRFGAYLHTNTPLVLVPDLWQGTLEKFGIFVLNKDRQYREEFPEKLRAVVIKHPNVAIGRARSISDLWNDY